MRRIAWVLPLLALIGCQSYSLQEPVPPVHLGTVAWADLIGLTQDEIRARFGIAPTGETFAERAKLLDGVVIATSALAGAGGAARIPCPQPVAGGKSFVAFSSDPDQLVFRDFRFAGVARTRAQVPRESLSAKCVVYARERKSRDETINSINDGQNAMFPILAVLYPATLASRPGAKARQAKRAQIFAELRLGEAPPGEPGDWIKANSEIVSVATDSAGRTVISAKIASDGGHIFGPQAILMDGRVVELSRGSSQRCVLRADRSFLCTVLPDFLARANGFRNP